LLLAHLLSRGNHDAGTQTNLRALQQNVAT
jgi:hypothetical protein